jgi:predicted DNA-binding helix-hairpin-helix protein
LCIRRFQNLSMEHLKKIGVSVNRAKYFISVSNENTHLKFLNALNLKEIILGDMKSKFENHLIINYHYSMTQLSW